MRISINLILQNSEFIRLNRVRFISQNSDQVDGGYYQDQR